MRLLAPAFRLALGLFVLAGSAIAANPALPIELDLQWANPSIVAGHPLATPQILPDDLIDPNVPTSAFAGVVSLNPHNDDGSFICSGTLVSDRLIITAAHCVDNAGGRRSTGVETGDGNADYTPEQITVVFNHDNPTSDKDGATIVRGVKAIHVHPDWHGFLNIQAPEGQSLHDDLAVIELLEPAPASIPRYTIDITPFLYEKTIVTAGYGQTGTGLTGYNADSQDFFVKRWGQNSTARYVTDDDTTSDTREVFSVDFDAPDDPDGETDTLDDGPSLGNLYETIIGPGDSGGPAFTWIDDGDEIPQAEELYLWGVNSYTFGGGLIPSAPYFGSQAGGAVLSAYTDFLLGIPEPTSLVVIGVGGLALVRRRRAG